MTSKLPELLLNKQRSDSQFFDRYNRQLRGRLCKLVDADWRQSRLITQKWEEICHKVNESWSFHAIFGNAHTREEYSKIDERIMGLFLGVVYEYVAPEGLGTLFHGTLPSFKDYNQRLFRQLCRDYNLDQCRLIRHLWQAICNRASWTPAGLKFETEDGSDILNRAVLKAFQTVIKDVLSDGHLVPATNVRWVDKFIYLFTGRKVVTLVDSTPGSTFNEQLPRYLKELSCHQTVQRLFNERLESREAWFSQYDRYVKELFVELIKADFIQSREIHERWKAICEEAFPGKTWDYAAVFDSAHTFKEFTLVHKEVMERICEVIDSHLTSKSLNDVLRMGLEHKKAWFKTYEQILYKKICVSRHYTAEQRRIIRCCWKAICAQTMANNGCAAWGPSVVSWDTEQELIAVDERMTKWFSNTIVEVLPEVVPESQSLKNMRSRYRYEESKLPEFLEMMKSLSEHDNQTGNKSASFEERFNQLMATLAFYPLADGQSITVPQKIGGRWVPIEYRIEKIAIPAPWMSGLEASHAYGLTPVSARDASPWLLFRGTQTKWGSSGMVYSLLADLTPGRSVGEVMLDQGKANLQTWVTKTPGRIVVTGTSLGGAMASQFAHRYAERVKAAYVYASPGQLWRALDHGDTPIYTVIRRTDVVTWLGLLPEGAGSRLLMVVDAIAPGLTNGHCEPHIEGPSVVLRVKSESENRSYLRKVLVVLHQTVALFVTCAFAIGRLFKTPWDALAALKR